MNAVTKRRLKKAAVVTMVAGGVGLVLWRLVVTQGDLSQGAKEALEMLRRARFPNAPPVV